MSQDGNWPLHLWVGGAAVALMVGAATLGGSAWDWLERAQGPVVIEGWRGGVYVPPTVEALNRDPAPADRSARQ